MLRIAAPLAFAVASAAVSGVRKIRDANARRAGLAEVLREMQQADILAAAADAAAACCDVDAEQLIVNNDNETNNESTKAADADAAALPTADADADNENDDDKTRAAKEPIDIEQGAKVVNKAAESQRGARSNTSPLRRSVAGILPSWATVGGASSARWTLGGGAASGGGGDDDDKSKNDDYADVDRLIALSVDGSKAGAAFDPFSLMERSWTGCGALSESGSSCTTFDPFALLTRFSTGSGGAGTIVREAVPARRPPSVVVGQAAATPLPQAPVPTSSLLVDYAPAYAASVSPSCASTADAVVRLSLAPSPSPDDNKGDDDERDHHHLAIADDSNNTTPNADDDPSMLLLLLEVSVRHLSDGSTEYAARFERGDDILVVAAAQHARTPPAGDEVSLRGTASGGGGRSGKGNKAARVGVVVRRAAGACARVAVAAAVVAGAGVTATVVVPAVLSAGGGGGAGAAAAAANAARRAAAIARTEVGCGVCSFCLAQVACRIFRPM